MLARLRQTARVGDARSLGALLSAAPLQARGLAGLGVAPVAPRTLLDLVEGLPRQVVWEGARAAVVLDSGSRLHTAWFFLEQGAWRLDPEVAAAWKEADPGPPHPLNRNLDLHEAVAGIRGTGPLVATLHTSLGPVRCLLAEAHASRAVANFVGLARGLRASLVRRQGQPVGDWQLRRFYDGLLFHRAVPGWLVQTGCPGNDGTGDAGYALPDELSPALRHDRPGVLARADRGPHTGSSQILVLLRPAPWLDERQVVFGHCADLEVLARLAALPAGQGVLKQVSFERRDLTLP